jgi:hypothetical protein
MARYSLARRLIDAPLVEIGSSPPSTRSRAAEAQDDAAGRLMRAAMDATLYVVDNSLQDDPLSPAASIWSHSGGRGRG